MPEENLPDLVLAKDQEEWLQCFVVVVYGLANGNIARVDRWQAQLKAVIQSYADLWKEGKISKPYRPEKIQDMLLIRKELLERYEAIEKFEGWLAKKTDQEAIEDGKS